MKIKLGILLLASIMILTSCDNAGKIISSLPEENVLLSYEQIATENQKLIAENERLTLILHDNGLYSETERHPLDIEFENVTFASDVRYNSSKIKHLFSDYRDKWKNEIDKYLILLTDKLDDDKLMCVAESQAKWEEMINADHELLVQSSRQVYGNGSIISEFTASNYYYQYRTRALYLKRIYDTVKDTVKNNTQPLG